MTTPQQPRLAPGELRRMVAQHLHDNRPGIYGAPNVARALQRSSGAVANALTALADNGDIAMVSAGPATYTANDATERAAITPIGAGAARAKAVPLTPFPAAPAAHLQTASGPVTRPNGQTYHPRDLAGLSDVTALRKLREAGVAALLYGPPGTGKTSLVEAAHQDLITVAGDGDTEVADFVGEYVQTPDGRFEFVYGPLIQAMQQGRALLIDDATLISPKVLAVVYPAMDGRREITVKAHKGETITAAEGFYVIAGHNPGVHGAVLTEALASRFGAHIEVTSDYDLAVKLKINAKAIRVAKNLAARQRGGEVGWAPQLRELLAFARMEEVLGAEAAVANLLGIAPAEDQEVVAEVIQMVFGREYAPLGLGRQV